MEISLEVLERKETGKNAVKRLRQQEQLVPGVVYGGKGETKLISITDKALRKATEAEAFFSQIVNIKINGSSEKVVLKELQRHPYRPFFVHADFQRVREDVKLTINIPLHYLNAETCKGVKEQGGALTYDLTEVEISCLPKDLPAFIEVDLAELELNQVLHLSELNLPKDVEAVALAQDKDGDHDMPVVRVITQRTIEKEDELEAELEAEAAEAAEAAEGEEAEAAEGEEAAEGGKDAKDGGKDAKDGGKDAKDGGKDAGKGDDKAGDKKK